MSEKNWPEPVAIRYSPSFIFPDVVLKPYDPSILENVKKHTATQAEVLYTAAQVREIVAAEVAEVRAKLAEDAERFAFLASNPYWDGHAWWAPDIFICADPKEPSIKGLRAAIDAARAAKGGE